MRTENRFTHPFSPLFMTDGSVRISPTPKNTNIAVTKWEGFVFTGFLPAQHNSSLVFSYVQSLKGQGLKVRGWRSEVRGQY